MLTTAFDDVSILPQVFAKTTKAKHAEEESFSGAFGSHCPKMTLHQEPFVEINTVNQTTHDRKSVARNLLP